MKFLKYFIGYMYADGYLRKDGKTIELHTHINDLESHFLFLSLINHNDYTFNISGSDVKTVVRDYGLYQILHENRVVNNKTYNGNFPLISTNTRDFLRGYFDGDGHLGDDMIEFCAKRKKVLLQLKEYYLKPLKIDCKIKKHKQRNYYYLRIYKDRHKFLKFIYYKDCCCLTRKKNTYDKYFK